MAKILGAFVGELRLNEGKLSEIALDCELVAKTGGDQRPNLATDHSQLFYVLWERPVE